MKKLLTITNFLWRIKRYLATVVLGSKWPWMTFIFVILFALFFKFDLESNSTIVFVQVSWIIELGKYSEMPIMVSVIFIIYCDKT